MPTPSKLLLLITTAYLVTLFTLLHTFRLALDLSPGRRPQTSNVSLSSTNSSSFPPLSFKSALYDAKAIIGLFDPRTETGNGVSWLARLGWGLGEATVEVLESSPPRTFEARAAFFGRSIPEDGLVGWLVPLDSLFKPCSDQDVEHSDETAEIHAPRDELDQPSSHSLPNPSSLPPLFSALDGAYVGLPVVDVDGNLLDPFPPEVAVPDNQENTGCPLQCPISESLESYQPTITKPWPLASPAHPFPNATWLALVRRGTCSFVTKARFAESLGASGLLVGGLDEDLISMSPGSGDGDILIRSVFIGNRAYSELLRRVQESGVRLDVDGGAEEDGERDLFGRSVKTILIRLEGEPPWAWYTPILSVLLVLSLPSLLTLCTLFVHRLRAERREREMRAPEDVVAGLPIRVWSGVRWEKDLERGDAVDIPDNSQTERSPILPVRSVSKEGDRAVHAGYGTIGDAEPSTSAPRSGTDALSNAIQLGIGSTTPTDAVVVTDNGSRDKQTARVILPAQRLQPAGKHHRQEDSDETIPRPPWFTSQTECAICLCNFEVGDRVRVLPCGHVFHLDEVDPWLIKQRKVCPVCKYDVTNPPTALVPPSVSPLRSPTMLPFDLQEPVPPPAVDSADEMPGTNSSPSSDSSAAFSQSHGRDVTAAQLLASVDGRQRGWRHWLGRRFTRTTSGSDERLDRREDHATGE